MIDHEEAKKIAEELVRTIEDNNPGPVFAPDVFCDINVPLWRFQIRGTDAIRKWLGSAQPDGSFAKSWRADATESGVVVEVEQQSGTHVARNLHRLEVRDGKITEWTMYCTGDWDIETQERQAREAPMLRAGSPE